MKKLILLELAFLFLATTFSSNPPPPGWYQQTLPVSDQINDIFFLDSLNGWAVTNGSFIGGDTGYILHTVNGGDNWFIQYSRTILMDAIQFTDNMTGYIVGNFYAGTGNNILKTTNGGNNWNELKALTNVSNFNDLSFLNEKTGWICSNDAFDGGVFKTTNGGISWNQELNLGIGNPLKIFFVNADIGWFGNDFGQLYKTINGGLNWNPQFSFGSGNELKDIFFISNDTGWASTFGEDNLHFTSNGGNSWVPQFLPPKGGIIVTSRPDNFSSLDGKTVWTVGGGVFLGTGRFKGIIYKSTNSGNNWFYQLPDTSINIATYTNIQFVNDSTGWAANTGIIKTTDGGGPLVNINNINSDLPKTFLLFQNYPNPFNPNTIIGYQISSNSFVRLKAFDITGREIKTLVNQRQNPGEYKFEFNGSDLNSGVYFYQLEVIDNKTNEIFSETKKMFLVK